QVVGQRDDGGVDVLDHLGDVGGGARHSPAARQRLRPLEVAVDQRRRAGVARRGERRQVVQLGDGAAADDGDAEGFHLGERRRGGESNAGREAGYYTSLRISRG